MALGVGALGVGAWAALAVGLVPGVEGFALPPLGVTAGVQDASTNASNANVPARFWRGIVSLRSNRRVRTLRY
jgi:hypothetical protein